MVTSGLRRQRDRIREKEGSVYVCGCRRQRVTGFKGCQWRKKRVGEGEREKENESLTLQRGGGGRRGGVMNENQENGENEMWDFRGLDRETRTRKWREHFFPPSAHHKRSFLPSFLSIFVSLRLIPLILFLKKMLNRSSKKPTQHLYNKAPALQQSTQVSATCVGGRMKKRPIYNPIHRRCCCWCFRNYGLHNVGQCSRRYFPPSALGAECQVQYRVMQKRCNCRRSCPPWIMQRPLRQVGYKQAQVCMSVFTHLRGVKLLHRFWYTLNVNENTDLAHNALL